MLRTPLGTLVCWPARLLPPPQALAARHEAEPAAREGHRPQESMPRWHPGRDPRPRIEVPGATLLEARV